MTDFFLAQAGYDMQIEFVAIASWRAAGVEYSVLELAFDGRPSHRTIIATGAEGQTRHVSMRASESVAGEFWRDESDHVRTARAEELLSVGDGPSSGRSDSPARP